MIQLECSNKNQLGATTQHTKTPHDSVSVQTNVTTHHIKRPHKSVTNKEQLSFIAHTPKDRLLFQVDVDNSTDMLHVLKLHVVAAAACQCHAFVVSVLECSQTHTV